jgi:hypothetical protein
MNTYIQTIKKCKKHPGYDGIKRPDCPCEECWEIFLIKAPRITEEKENGKTK